MINASIAQRCLALSIIFAIVLIDLFDGLVGRDYGGLSDF